MIANRTYKSTVNLCVTQVLARRLWSAAWIMSIFDNILGFLKTKNKKMEIEMEVENV